MKEDIKHEDSIRLLTPISPTNTQISIFYAYNEHISCIFLGESNFDHV